MRSPVTWRPSIRPCRQVDVDIGRCESQCTFWRLPSVTENLMAVRSQSRRCQIAPSCELSSRKWRPRRSSTSISHRSESKLASRARNASASASRTPSRRKARDPAPVALGSGEAGRRRPEHEAGSVEPVDLDEDRAGVVVAVAHDDGGCALDGAPANVALHPEFRPEPHGRHSRARVGGRKCGLPAVLRQFEISSSRLLYLPNGTPSKGRCRSHRGKHWHLLG